MAIVFLVALFLIKNKTYYSSQTKEVSKETNQTDGLTYTNETIGDLASKDTDGDGVLDWEEGLWGTDPTKKDSDEDGIPDNIEIDKLKSESNTVELGKSKNTEETPTQTSRFSEELITTIAALTQNGSEIDQTTIEQLGATLAENMSNYQQNKIFTLSDIKINPDTSIQSFQNYFSSLALIQQKHPLNIDVATIFSQSITPDQEIDTKNLSKLLPLAKEMNAVINEMLALKTPSEWSLIHLDVINNFEKVKENLNDMQLIDADAIIAFSAITQYESNVTKLQNSMAKLIATMVEKLKY